MDGFNRFIEMNPKISKVLILLGIWFLMFIITGPIAILVFDPTIWIGALIGSYLGRQNTRNRQLFYSFAGAVLVNLLFILTFDPRHPQIFGRIIVSIFVAYWAIEIQSSIFKKIGRKSREIKNSDFKSEQSNYFNSTAENSSHDETESFGKNLPIFIKSRYELFLSRARILFEKIILMRNPVTTPIAFNKALAEVGLGSRGLNGTVPTWVRRLVIQACIDGEYPPKLGAAKLHQVYFSHHTAFRMAFSLEQERKSESTIDAWVQNGDIPSNYYNHINNLLEFKKRNYLKEGDEIPSELVVDGLDKLLLLFLVLHDDGLGWPDDPTPMLDLLETYKP